MHASIIGVKEIATVGNPLRVGRTQGTLLPLRLPHPSAVLLKFSNDMNPKLDLVFDAGRSCRNQPPCAL